MEMDMSNFYDLYICYSSEDQDEIMPYINEILSWKANGTKISCFWDKNIPAGANWVDALNEGLFNSKNFIIFLTKNWMKSEWVHYEIALSTWQKKQNNDIEIFPLRFPGAGFSKAIKDSLIQHVILDKGEEIRIIRERIGNRLNVKFSSLPGIDRSSYLKANVNIRPETLSDKIIVTKEAVIKLHSNVVINSIETNINNLDEEGFNVLLDWLRYLRYDGQWKKALNLMEDALDNHKLLGKSSTLLFWMELEYFILRYEYKDSDFYSHLKKSSIFGFDAKKFKENFENIIIAAARKFREFKSSDGPEKLWLKVIGLKALGNIYKEIDREKISEARKFCLEALKHAEEIENKFPSFLDPDNFRVLMYDCYRELGNVELYDVKNLDDEEKLKAALEYFRQALNEIETLQNGQLKDSLISLLFYHWGRLLIKVDINIPYVAFLLENSRIIFEGGKIPRNNVRLASILSQLGRLIPKMKSESEIIEHEKRNLIKLIRQDVSNIQSVDFSLVDKYNSFNQSNLLKEAKKYLEDAREISLKIGHFLTMKKIIVELIRLNSLIILHSKDHSDKLEVLSEAHNTFEEYEEFYPINRINRGTEDYYSQNDELKRMLLDIYSMGIYICAQLSQDEFERELKRRYKSMFGA